jgi:dTDP-4-amino-4,6-dideoxygalactose transaminase
MISLYRHSIDSIEEKGSTWKIPLINSTSSVRLATGRSALYHLLHKLPRPHAETVLLPCYVAEGVIQPFIVAGFSLRFYRLDADLNPVPDDIDRILKQVDGTAVVILVHYFGFTIKSDDLPSVLYKHDVVVVHDCAHALYNTRESFGVFQDSMDVILYSLNKFLPVVDGAYLLSNRPDIDIAIDTSILQELPIKAQQAYLNHLEAAKHLYECVSLKLAKGYFQEISSHYEEYYNYINKDLRPSRPSAQSERLEASYPHNELINQRVRNSNTLFQELKSPYFSLVHPDLPKGVVPFAVPVRVPANHRKEIIRKLMEQGIILSTLEDKWDFVPANDHDYFIEEVKFLKENVLLPISEHITNDDICNVAKAINNIILTV